jgi:ADP-dependent NAD(P)H-hydrate dehydratase
MPRSDLPRLPRRAPDSHKGDYGHVLLIGGSTGMAGAISLSGMAALRSGAGLVTIATPQSCQPIVAGFEASFMVMPLACDLQGRLTGQAFDRIAELSKKCTTICIGPGMQHTPETEQLVARVYSEFPQPIVVDADALNALAAQRDRLPDHQGQRVLTPHPGEFARLTGGQRLTDQDRVQRAKEFAASNRLILVLKGHRTIVTDGEKLYENDTGNPGMATGGSGDVLTGIIGALAGQGLSLFEATQLGVYVHGLAGDSAAEASGQIGMIASDIVRSLPQAFKKIAG